MLRSRNFLSNLKKDSSTQLPSLGPISKHSLAIAFQKTLSRNYSKYLAVRNFLAERLQSGANFFFSAALSDPSKLLLNSPPSADCHYFLAR